MATTTRKLADLAQFVANDSTIGTGGIVALDSADVTTGTFATGQIPSLDANKITAFSTKRLAAEMMYVGEKMSKIEKGTKLISIFDSNWGLFQKDVELADHIAKVMDKYDWPQQIKSTTPKTNWNNL